MSETELYLTRATLRKTCPAGLPRETCCGLSGSRLTIASRPERLRAAPSTLCAWVMAFPVRGLSTARRGLRSRRRRPGHPWLRWCRLRHRRPDHRRLHPQRLLHPSLHPRAEHEALAAARMRQESEEGRQLYGQRQGIEGTIAQGVRSFGLRRARYRGLAKTTLQSVATAAALNLDRLAAWFSLRPLAPTRTSRFKALAA